MSRQPHFAWDDDPLRRSLIERAPPLTWKGIGFCALVMAIGFTLGLAKFGGLWNYLALGLFVFGGIQVLRGVLRMGWLGLGGTDRPLRAYFRKRLGSD
jgi:hypothetical protein